MNPLRWLLASLLIGLPLGALGAPANDRFASAIILSGNNVLRTGSNLGATSEIGEPFHAQVRGGASVWYSWTAPQNGFVIIATEGSSFDTLLAVYTGGSVTALTPVASNDDSGTGLTSRVSFSVRVGVTYRIAVDGYYGDQGSIRLTLQATDGSPPANDNYANARVLTGTLLRIQSSNIMASMEPGERTPVTYGGASVWFVWEAPSSEWYLINTFDSPLDTILSIYNGNTLVGWNDDEVGRTSAVRFRTQRGVRYHISVQGYEAEMNTFSLQIWPDPPEPAPPWTLRAMDGSVLRSSDFAGRVVMLDFWATWCGPCVAEVPDFIAMQNQYGPAGFDIIGVSVDVDGWNAVIPFVAAYGVNYISTLTTDQIEFDYGPITAIPTTFVIDRQGMIAGRYVGSRSRAFFDSVLLPLIYPAVEVSLTATREGNEIVLRWPVSATGYRLESSVGVGAGALWASDAAPITIVGELHVARSPLSGSARTFRLIHD